MPKYVEFNGNVIEFPDNLPDDEIAAVLSQQAAPAEQPKKEGLGSQLMHQAGMTVRAGIKGAGQMASLFGDALNSAINLALPKDKQLPMMSATINKLADAVAVPANEQERVLDAAATTVAGVIANGGIKAGVDWLVSKGVNSTVATKAAQELGKNLGQQATAGAATAATAQQVTESTDSPLLGLAAGTAVGVITGKAPAAARKTAQEAFDAANVLYEKAKASGLTFKAAAGRDLTKSIVETMKDNTLSLSGSDMSQVRASLRNFRSTFNTPEGIKITDVEKLRRDANNLISNAGGNQNQRAAGYAIRNAIDEFMGNVDSTLIKSGDKEGIKLLVEGRGTFRTASRASILEDVLSAAKYKAEINPNTDFPKTIQKEITALLRKEKLLKANFTEEEIARLKDVAKGGKGLEMLLKGVGLGTGLAGKAAALVNAPTTGGASLLGYLGAKGVEMAAQKAGAAARQRGIEDEISRILGGQSTQSLFAPASVGSMSGLRNFLNEQEQ